MRTSIRTAIAVSSSIGLALGIVLTTTLWPKLKSANNVIDNQAEKPLYWVAPMDANYRRDKPGKSPMGMDLVPVYANKKKDGLVTIAPEIINSLGVKTALVSKRVISPEIKTFGIVQYDEEKLIHIHPRVEGWVDELFVKSVGDPVAKGQALYALYAPELVNAQEDLLLSINQNNQRLIRGSEDRLRALQISESFIQALKRNKRVAQRVTFYAPQSGVVDQLPIRQGFYVEPGTTMLSIGALDEVWVEAEVFERHAPFVEKGNPVIMTLDYFPGEIWHGTVDYVYPTLNAQTRTLRLRLKFKNPEKKLKPNMHANVTVKVKDDNVGEVLAVPNEALIRTGRENRIVLDKGEGEFLSVSVKVGRRDKDYTEILEGLSDGQRVVTSAQFLLDSESNKRADLNRIDSQKHTPSMKGNFSSDAMDNEE